MSSLRSLSQGTSRGSHYLGDYLMCQHLFWLRNVQKIRRRGSYAAPLFGTAWHKMLEVYFWGRALHERPSCLEFLPPGLVTSQGEDLYELALEVGLTGLGPIRESEEGGEEFDRAKVILTRAWQAYFKEVIEIEEPVTRQVWLASGAPAIECAFELPLSSGRIYTGRLDRVIEQRGLIGVRDYKTTAAANFVELDAHIGLQFTGYWAGFHHLFGKSPDWVLVDVMEKPRKNSRLSNWTPSFKSIPVSRSPAQIAEWTQEVDALLREIEGKIIVDTYPYDANTKAHWYKARNDRCYNQFYRECPYLSICVTPGHSLTQEALGERWTVGDVEGDSPSDVFGDL